TRFSRDWSSDVCSSDLREGDFTVPCGFVESGEPFGYGDDPAFDLLWSSCAAGDGVACDDLFFQTPIGSAYEAFGRVCSDLTEVEIGRASCRERVVPAVS